MYRTMIALALAAFTATGGASAATTTYTMEAAFLAAAPGTTSDDFESSTFDGTTIGFSAGTITCAGGNFCNTFYGNQFGSGLARSGVKAPFFGTPDTLTFTFTTPIDAFGIFIGGSGDVGVQTLSFAIPGETFTPFPNYTNGSGTFVNNTLFFGIVSDVPFTTVAVSGEDIDDGVFLDDLSYRTVAEVPVPAAALLLGAGLSGLGLVSRRRRDALRQSA